jgi:hypothetical protein
MEDGAAVFIPAVFASTEVRKACETAANRARKLKRPSDRDQGEAAF